MKWQIFVWNAWMHRFTLPERSKYLFGINFGKTRKYINNLLSLTLLHVSGWSLDCLLVKSHVQHSLLTATASILSLILHSIHSHSHKSEMSKETSEIYLSMNWQLDKLNFQMQVLVMLAASRLLLGAPRAGVWSMRNWLPAPANKMNRIHCKSDKLRWLDWRHIRHSHKTKIFHHQFMLVCGIQINGAATTTTTNQFSHFGVENRRFMWLSWK